MAVVLSSFPCLMDWVVQAGRAMGVKASFTRREVIALPFQIYFPTGQAEHPWVSGSITTRPTLLGERWSAIQRRPWWV